jgi:aldose 1-epimerase
LSIIKQAFGKTSDGHNIDVFILEYGSVKVRIINYGATIVSIEVPDRDGIISDVVCGFDDMAGYQSADNPYFGACCGRYANRIAHGKFTLDGNEYSLALNDGPNALHGGLLGFDKKVWHARIIGDALKMTLVSPHGEEGYPGTLTVDLTFSLNSAGELRLDYCATCDRKTVLNLTNHSYFNLAGHDSGFIYDQIIQINADRYTEVDEFSIPTGKLVAVTGTEMDLTVPTPIGKHINEVQGLGYDHNYCINQSTPSTLTLAATVLDPESGRTLECWTSEPGVQFYSGNYLENTRGKVGAVYKKHQGFCLETQHFPDSPNQPDFPPTELSPDEIYTHTCMYKFGVA